MFCSNKQTSSLSQTYHSTETVPSVSEMLPAQEKKKRDDDLLLEGVGLVNVQPVTKIEANVRAVLGQRGLKPKVWAVVAPEVALLVALAAALIANGRLDGGGGQRLALAVVNPVGNLAADGAVGRRGLEQGLLPLVEVGKVLGMVREKAVRGGLVSGGGSGAVAVGGGVEG